MIRSILAASGLCAAFLFLAPTLTATHQGKSVGACAAVDVLQGTIKSVDSEGAGLVLTSDAGDVSVRLSAATTYSLDGKDSTRAEALRVGARARVTHSDRTASRVDVQTKADLALVREIQGSIKSVEAEAMSFVLATRDGEVTVGVGPRTHFSLDGKESTMTEALKTGLQASVVIEGRVAERVSVSSKP